MTNAFATQWLHSSKKTPCPICSRSTDGDCRWTDDLILCHQGTTFSPPADLRPGDTLTVNGQKWALIRRDGGFDGAAAVFRPHRSGGNAISHPTPELDRKARHVVAAFSVERFLERFRECWEIPDFHGLPPDRLREAFELIDGTYAQGLALARSLAPVWRDEREFEALYRWRIESCLKSLKYQQQEVAHFRRHYLGEVWV
ncbi:MAG: hypothetical protein RLZZ32_1780 [Cyanobacteriota bacterium]